MTSRNPTVYVILLFIRHLNWRRFDHDNAFVCYRMIDGIN